ncbi:hypothetical protein L6452_09642 [Arctium lappa]|uniref:Uncharacterized protein n=1 Tax=Arctium lappa TaxID=4217 RepID=A0ACB9DLS2_ARCLA|nr:hypothetical protein L6452_09642 [Arctium lappa]
MAVKSRKGNGAHEKASKALATAVIVNNNKHPVTKLLLSSPHPTPCELNLLACGPPFSPYIYPPPSPSPKTTHSIIPSYLHIVSIAFYYSLEAMESMKLKFFAAVLVIFMAVTSVAAQMAPAPPPTSDAVAFVPIAAIASSIVAISFGFLF